MKTEYIIFIVLLVILGAHLLLNNSKSNKGLKTGKVDLGNFPRPQISRNSLQLSNNIVSCGRKSLHKPSQAFL